MSCEVFGWQINGNILGSFPVAGCAVLEVGLSCCTVRKIRIKTI